MECHAKAAVFFSPNIIKNKCDNIAQLVGQWSPKP